MSTLDIIITRTEGARTSVKTAARMGYFNNENLSIVVNNDIPVLIKALQQVAENAWSRISSCDLEDRSHGAACTCFAPLDSEKYNNNRERFINDFLDNALKGGK